MIKTRLTAGLLAAVLAISLIAPVGAVSTSFSDVTDGDTAVYADVLRLMGVVDGVGDNQFNPNGTLTRGAFCKMLVTYLGLEDQLSLHSTRTIFTDVPASHWASSYVNLAASTSGGDEGMLIAGVGNGSFQPDSVITYGQAITILVRTLGYSDSDTGAIWPQGYLNLATAMGLTQGMSFDADAPLLRSDAAQLFVQAMSCDTKSGTPHYETLGGMATEEVMVLATNVSGDSGATGAIRTSQGTYFPQGSGVNPVALQGRRGVLVISDKQELITFLPDDSTSTAITLSGGAQATYLTATGGTRYTIASTTPVFTYGETTDESIYSDSWTDLSSGTRLTLFVENGTVTAIYAGIATVAETAVVVTETPTRSTFYALAGGRTDFSILRNGQEITASKIAVDDVVTYEATTNSLIVSDLRISAVYESGSPNSTTPTTIHVLGHDFPVLEDALDQSDNVKVGDKVCFLLTADGQIAAIKTTSTARRSTVYGIAGENSVDIQLPNGEIITLTGDNTIGAAYQNRVVTVSSYRAGQITVTGLSSSRSGQLDVGAMTLGGRTIAPEFALYEQVMGGAAVKLEPSSLDMDYLEEDDIASYRLDGSGNVDIIVLDGVTGDGYTYGKLIETPTDKDADLSNRLVTVENSGNGTTPAISGIICTTPFADGVFGGVTLGVDKQVSPGYYTPAAGSVVILKEIDGISRADFFTADGKTYVKAKGTSYEVSDQVECYNEDSDSWTTLTALRSYTDTLTIYVDPLGSTVRVIAGVD